MRTSVLEYPIKTWKDFKKFSNDSIAGMLTKPAPRKGEDFYLFRGVSDCQWKLVSSLAREAGAVDALKFWRTRIAQLERDLLNRFLRDIEPCSLLKSQYRWLVTENPKTNTFWYLSVMQHYRAPTRLVDFTADFWTAVFFAFDGNVSGKCSAIYRLKCKNEDKYDLGGNKLPKNKKSEPRWFGAKKVDTNQLLGHLIGYGNFAPRCLQDDPLWAKPTQVFGWDRPAVQNPRVRRQTGYFVYNLDVAKTLEEEIADSVNTEIVKFVIDASLREPIRKELTKRNHTPLTTYLDLDREFFGWWENDKQRPQI